eukprot:CAMPEP_0170743288 /NCGR_PEP_ID=MMETSP0437-20130122/7187_1 /TAXON_ID=0 /ORGANISM="Sexangularia sp." /LENGTH=541 /DNA_ID=CAMNT_0011081945 /DNA_START=97 /DNA_END=1722 /DNA_ORIENTATION=-
MAGMMQPSIILLREGTDQSQGLPQIISNINACQAIVATVATTLGPRGMDKLIYMGGEGMPSRQIISNDGATILKNLDIVHPAARTLVDIAKSQDEEVGDGTTSVVVLTGELLKEAKYLLEDGVHPRIIVKGLRLSCRLALEKIRSMAVDTSAKDNAAEFRTMLEHCASTAMNSKLVASAKGFFSKMVVDAVETLDSDMMPINMIGIKKEAGGAMEESEFVQGVAFKKTFSYAGFEQQPKRFDNPKVLALNIELELKAERDNAEIRMSDPAQYQSIVDAEWKIIYDKLAACVTAGAQVVLSRQAIGDLGTQYFADRGIFCAGRVEEEDMDRVCKATGAVMQTSLAGVTAGELGTCELFEERRVGKERYNFFTGCPKAKTCTLILRGGGEHFIDEAHRSLHDAIMIVRRAKRTHRVVAGGGATEMEVSKYLRDYSRTIKGKQQVIVAAFARALEAIPRQISDNAGFDPTDVLNQLRKRHNEKGGHWYGVDVMTGGVCDTFASFVWEPELSKLNGFSAATEAATLILSVDETIKSEKRQTNPGQ